ncbi:MAG: trehalose-phosphatase [Gemmatimonadales bacterium]
MSAGTARRTPRLPAPPAPRRDWAYFFDVDGTLIELADTPGGVRVSAELRLLLERLYEDAGGAVALISGRPINDIDTLFPHVRMPVAGQHGVERRNAAGVVTRHDFPAERFERARHRLADAVNGKPGLLLEYKGLSLALHYRRAPRLAGYAHRLARSMLPVLGREFCIQRGKRVVEMKPAGKDKGVGVLEFMQESPFQGRTAVFVGDDATDEYGFATVNRLGGHSVKVGPGRTAARFRLRDVLAVQQWLSQ